MQIVEAQNHLNLHTEVFFNSVPGLFSEQTLTQILDYASRDSILSNDSFSIYSMALSIPFPLQIHDLATILGFWPRHNFLGILFQKAVKILDSGCDLL